VSQTVSNGPQSECRRGFVNRAGYERETRVEEGRSAMTPQSGRRPSRQERERSTERAADPEATLLLVASSGGHLTQLFALEPWWTRHPRAWVTFNDLQARSLLSGEDVTWAFGPTTRNIPNLLRNTVVAARTLRRRRPKLIVSTGAGVAIPFIVLGWLMRIPTAFIEVYDRLDMPTLTGRMVRPFASVVLVQWPEQLVAYRKGVLIGPLL
jgi:UDP-N-acetylglucosamine:LPS N-acetylglucosamine transferase